MKTLLSRAALAAAAMALGLSDAQATTATANLNVSLQVTSSCTVSATPLNFGSATLSSNVDATATISVTCGSGNGYSVTLGDGQHSVGSGMLASSSGLVEYSLYTDSNRSAAWFGATAVPGTGTGSAQSIPVYGRVPASTGTVPGSYSDVVQIIVTY
jgi:spore coat protein U domain-containing protein, fimbrial subunit CupE1/2/3/6